MANETERDKRCECLWHRKQKSMYRQDVEASARACVEEGGGVWVGIRDCEGFLYDLVMFNSKTGSTFALKTTEITPELVRKHIQNSDAKFRRAKHVL